MTLVERLKAFLFRKRRWRWIAVGVALVAIGQILDAQNIEASTAAKRGVALTARLHNRLATLQPGAIADLYRRAGRDRHGIGWCGPTEAHEPLSLRPGPHLKRNPNAPPVDIATVLAEAARRHPAPVAGGADDPIGNVMAPLERQVGLPRPRLTPDPLGPLTEREGLGARQADVAPPPKRAAPDWNCERGWLAMIDAAALNLRTTPEIIWVVWKEGGWSATILLALTLAGMAALIISMWKTKDIGCAAFPATLVVLALGPLLAGGLFWVMLWALLALTKILGHVLAGLALVLGWLAGLSKIVMMGFEMLTKSDEAEENYEALKASLGMDKPPPD